MSQKQIDIKSEADMATFAQNIASTAKVGDIFLLRGPLGAGKSAFARAFIQYLVQSNIDVPSPTFTLVQQYDTDEVMISHLDLYRLEDPEEIYELGWEDFITDSIVLVEWPERLGHLTPSTHILLNIDVTDDGIRKITYDESRSGGQARYAKENNHGNQ